MNSISPAEDGVGEVTVVTNANGNSGGVTVNGTAGRRRSSNGSGSAGSRVSVEVNPRPPNPPPPPAAPATPEEVKVVSGRWSQYIEDGGGVGTANGGGSPGSGSSESVSAGRPGADAGSPVPILPALVQRSPGGTEKYLQPDDIDG